MGGGTPHKLTFSFLAAISASVSVSARAALREMMARNPELDTTGGMAARLADIDIELQAIL